MDRGRPTTHSTASVTHRELLHEPQRVRVPGTSQVLRVNECVTLTWGRRHVMSYCLQVARDLVVWLWVLYHLPPSQYPCMWQPLILRLSVSVVFFIYVPARLTVCRVGILC